MTIHPFSLHHSPLSQRALWHHEKRALTELHRQIVIGEGGQSPLCTYKIMRSSTSCNQPFAEKDLGILESYLTKFCRDGVPRHADMKQKLDQIAKNNIAILTLTKAYTPHARTAAFVPEGDKFRDYAFARRDP
jgi:hypothetical protein